MSEDRPRLHHVESSSIEAVGYDAALGRLFVRFRESGETYVYFVVKPAVYEGLLAAESKGQFVNLEIKGRYAYERLD